MLNEKKSKRGTVIALLCALALLALVILLENTMKPTGMLFTVLKKGAVYALVAVSMNLLNGFTGLFSLGQAGFMLLGAYTYAILTIPTADREAVYYLYNGSAVNFSLPELFGGGAVGLVLGVLLALFLGDCVAAAVAWLIGLPVLRLKSDYLAIATLGFAEIIRAIFQWDPLGPVTNGANALKNFPTFSSFNIQNADGKVILRLSTFIPFLLAGVCVAVIVLLINSTYGRAFKAIRDDEVAASEWWLRFLDAETYIGSFKVPFLRTGFRMVVFSVIIMVVVLFFRKGIMGDKELPDLLKKRQKKATKEAVQP